jgi:hypothetical protein
MKKILLTLFVTIICSNITAQTKQETIQWLNDKLQSSPIRLQGNMQTVMFFTANNDGTFTTKLREEAKLMNYISETSFKGNLSMLSPNSVVIKQFGDKYYIKANCRSGKCISQNSQYSDGHTTAFKSNDITFCMLEDSSLAERTKKALIHLIKLYGGKKEAF